ncbi:MAG: zf-HC2 domain-containing protein [Pseudomonadota bacterium]
MLSCKQTTELLSQGQDRMLNLREKIALRLHLAVCEGCRNFRRQIDFLRHACRHFTAGNRHEDSND